LVLPVRVVPEILYFQEALVDPKVQAEIQEVPEYPLILLVRLVLADQEVLRVLKVQTDQ